MIDYVKLALSRYAEFKGRSRRSEYWYWTLALVLVLLPFYVLGVALESTIFLILYVLITLATLVPGIAVLVRRLHDTGRSGWWYFIALVPLVGGIILLVFLATEGESGPNQYGPNPKNPGDGGYQPPPGQQWGQPAQQWGQDGGQAPQQPQQWGQDGGQQQAPQQPQQWGQDGGQQPPQQWGQNPQ